MLGSNMSPAQLLQGRSPSLDLDSLYGAGLGDPGSAKFYEADGIHLKMGKTTQGRPRSGFDLPRGAGNRRRSARRSSPTRATTRTSRWRRPLRDDPVPQPGGGHPAGLGPGGAEIRRGARDRHEALPVDDPHGLSAADLRTRRRERRLQQRAQGVRGRSPRRTFRRCRSSSRWRPSASATRWSAPLQLERGLRQRRRDARVAVRLLGARAATSAATPASPSIWIADFRRLYDFGEADKPNLDVPAAKFNRAMRIDTTIVDPLQHLPRERSGCRPTPDRRPRATSRSGTSRGRTC